jgi:hypothetical protein
VFEAADFGPEIAAKEGALMDKIGKRIEENKRASS